MKVKWTLLLIKISSCKIAIKIKDMRGNSQRYKLTDIVICNLSRQDTFHGDSQAKMEWQTSCAHTTLKKQWEREACLSI